VGVQYLLDLSAIVAVSMDSTGNRVEEVACSHCKISWVRLYAGDGASR
jgi:hypothetical protein